MCGIFAIFAKDGQPITTLKCSRKSLREIAYQQSGKQRHRGPDDTGVVVIPEHGVAMVHERLSVIGVQTGHQPLLSQDGNIVLVVNGEIYNYLELSAQIAEERVGYQPKSDCNVIIELYEKHGAQLLDYIDGMFAFVLYDKQQKRILAARDRFGIIPMYMGEDASGNVWFSSEMKCLVEHCPQLQVFPPGHLIMGTANKLQQHQYFEESWMTALPKLPADLAQLRARLESAVQSHLQCDVPFGALLSGGVDSSLIASIATKLRRKTDADFRLQTFSVGLKGAPDFAAAREVANHINSLHTELIFEIDDALDGIRDIIYHLETYDVTTVRCSLPMLLLSRFIKSSGIKMILSGEGADEIFGGYLYFFKAPTLKDFHAELVKRILHIHLSDCLRANKVTMAKGLELRVPFLDTNFVNYVMSIRPEDKIPGELNSFCSTLRQSEIMEKYILRAAFDGDYLPRSVLWRQKEQFSDGVGYDWIDTIRQTAAGHISDEQFVNAAKLYPYNTPSTKEAFYYRSIFEELFPGEAAAKTVQRWVPRLDWGCSEDPSGRAQKQHQCSY